MVGSVPRAGEKPKAERQRPGGAGVAAGSVSQLELFQSAMRLFHQRKFAEARELFERAAAGADRAIAHKALLQSRMCGQRLEEPALVLKTFDDHYNYAITLLNARNLGAARRHLEAALEMQPGADHVHYALALCRCLSGDLEGAHENLKHAIEIDPRNRVLARQDAEFAPFGSQPPLDRLLYPEKTPRY